MKGMERWEPALTPTLSRREWEILARRVSVSPCLGVAPFPSFHSFPSFHNEIGRLQKGAATVFEP